MSTTSDAHILVTILNATLTSSSSGTFTGSLALEYITFDIPSSARATATRDVLLVLRIGTGNGAFEAPLDPARALTVSTLPPPSGTTTATVTRYRYVFHATRDDSEFSVEFSATPETADDVELFHSVLVGYAADVHGDTEVQAAGARASDEEEVDLRGRFVLMNEDNGEIVGALDRSVRVREDPSLGERGHEDDPVVVELPEGGDPLDELRDIEVIVRTIPPEDRDWILKSAVFVRCVSSFLSFSSSLTKKGSRILQLCHLGHYHSAHERDVRRIEHVHRALDTGTVLLLLLFLYHRSQQGSSLKLKLKLEHDPTLAHAPPPAIPNDPETPDHHPHRQRRRRKAQHQSRRHRRPPDPARRHRPDQRQRQRQQRKKRQQCPRCCCCCYSRHPNAAAGGLIGHR